RTRRACFCAIFNKVRGTMLALPVAFILCPHPHGAYRLASANRAIFSQTWQVFPGILCKLDEKCGCLIRSPYTVPAIISLSQLELNGAHFLRLKIIRFGTLIALYIYAERIGHGP
ncbi:MAG TPA: hypothetical protein PK625_06340, partial [Spirochaetales bacterium]|nr:hypothetical protein [Spirochaetales bacterium]